MIFYVSCITFSSIDFALICYRFWDGFGYTCWYCFDTFSVRARNMLNLERTCFLQWVWMRLPFRETCCLMMFVIFVGTSFDIYLISLGTDVGTIFVSLWHRKTNVSGWLSSLNDFCYGVFIDFEQQRLPKVGSATTPFRHFVDPVPQVVFVKIHWLILVPFWYPFNSVLVILGTLLILFGKKKHQCAHVRKTPAE